MQTHTHRTAHKERERERQTDECQKEERIDSNKPKPNRAKASFGGGSKYGEDNSGNDMYHHGFVSLCV